MGWFEDCFPCPRIILTNFGQQFVFVFEITVVVFINNKLNSIRKENPVRIKKQKTYVVTSQKEIKWLMNVFEDVLCNLYVRVCCFTKVDI